MTHFPHFRMIAAAVLAGLLPCRLDAAETTLIDGVGVIASSEEGPVRVATNLVSRRGFDRDRLAVTDTTVKTTWNSLDETRETLWILFDLGATRRVGEMWVYNYNRAEPEIYRDRRFVTADVWYATGRITTYNPSDAAPGGWTKLVNDGQFREASYTENYDTPTKIPMNVVARYVVINDVVRAGPQPRESLCGLSKVIFHKSSR